MHFTAEQKSVFEEAIKKFGYASQVDMTIEECAELITALQHFKRNRAGINEVLEEVIDVAIMCEQMLIMFDKYAVNTDVLGEYKIKRLEERLKKQVVPVYIKDVKDEQ